MDISYKVKKVENFQKIIINVSDHGRPVNASVSVSVKTRVGKEYIFIPSYASSGRQEKNPAYPEEYLNFVNATDVGEYAVFFHNRREKIKSVKVFAQYQDVVEEKEFIIKI